MFSYTIVTWPKEYSFAVWQIASETLCVWIGMHKFWVTGHMVTYILQGGTCYLYVLSMLLVWFHLLCVYVCVLCVMYMHTH